MVKSQVVDDLHSAYLGLVKKMVIAMEEKKIFGDHSVYDLIDEELQKNKGISEISAIKGFASLADWKGKDFLSFLFFYGIPFLREYAVDQNYTQNLIHLSNAMFFCSREKVTEFDLDCAQRELDLFKSTYPSLYGETKMSPNYHEITEHMIWAIRNTGPLWINSTFNFEELNFLLRNCVRSSLRPDIQIYKR